MKGVNGIYSDDFATVLIGDKLWKGYPEFQDIPVTVGKITADHAGLHEVDDLGMIDNFEFLVSFFIVTTNTTREYSLTENNLVYEF